MVRLVFIPSYGTDSSLYTNLRKISDFPHETVFTEWLSVKDSDDLQQYAERFISTYKITKDDILIGVSLGGVLSIEINKLVEVRKVITISSIKSKEEKPTLFRILEQTRTYRLFSPFLLKIGLDLVVPLYGRKVKSYLWFRQVFKKTENAFLKWALKEIVCWQNEVIPDNLIHIHGTKDPLFPLHKARNVDYQIEGGTHAMIRFKALEIGSIINREIS